VLGLAVSSGDGRATFGEVSAKDAGTMLADASLPKWVHDAKDLEAAVLKEGGRVEGVVFDTLLAAYLLDPAEQGYPLDELARKYLGTDVLEPSSEAETDGQLFADASWRQVAAEAAAIALLAPVLQRRVEKAGLTYLLEEVELPLAAVLARMQANGVALDVEYLEEMSASVTGRMDALRIEIYNHAGEEFNLNSPPQLRAILYEKLGLSPGKKTPKGQLSTDASVLEKLRDQHPIVDALLQWRELEKLNSTYLAALPRLVNPATGRVHTTFNQAVAATGRLSSTNPNLQNIPVRTPLGRRIRACFVAEDGNALISCDYSQVELRVLAHVADEPVLREIFARGEDVHTATGAEVFGVDPAELDAGMRSKAKMVNYGIVYGLSAYGLADRLQIPQDEAQEFIDRYLDRFPAVRTYIAETIARATDTGYVSTLLGRRRVIPELKARNRQVRQLGERLAVNTPIQGSAADIIKVAMVRCRDALASSGLRTRLVLQIHDELLFEGPVDEVDAAGALVRREMESAYPLDPPLAVDLGAGPNWLAAK
jgi:DNA polymerase-1